MTQAITLPSGNRVSLGSYVKAWKALKAMTNEQRAHYRDYNWNWHANTGTDILRAIKAGVNDRINIRGSRG